MKNFKKGFSLVIPIVIIAVIVLGGGYFLIKNNQQFSPTSPIVGGDKDAHGCIPSAGYSWCEVKQKCLRTWEEKCDNTVAVTDAQSYTFKTVKKDIGEMLFEVYIEVYKNGELLKSILAGKGSGANNFVVSPDNSHVAFGLGYYGGSCVAGDNLIVLNLSSLSLNNAALAKSVDDSLRGNSGIQFIENIKWLSNNKIETVLKLGDENNDCGVMATSTAEYTISN